MELTAGSSQQYIVYLLTNDSNSCTYIGCTNNAARRIRQHNSEIVGGARYTKRHGADVGATWRFHGHIAGLDKHQALSIEKRIQIRSRKMKAPRAIDRRLRAIAEILQDYPGQNLLFETSVCTTAPLCKLATTIVSGATSSNSEDTA